MDFYFKTLTVRLIIRGNVDYWAKTVLAKHSLLCHFCQIKWYNFN